jgi:hypothetical protein
VQNDKEDCNNMYKYGKTSWDMPHASIQSGRFPFSFNVSRR